MNLNPVTIAGPQRVGIDQLANRLATQAQASRLIVAIAGPPGVGKTTFAENLRNLLDDLEPGVTEILPMDGYHFDDGLLVARGWRDRKGAPHTFDVGGLKSMLERLARNDEDEIFVPVFDRSIEIARAGARAIPRTCRIVLVEGNHLLLDTKPWAGLLPLFGVTVQLEAPLAEIRRRLTERWIHFGFSETACQKQIEENDMPNLRAVLDNSVPADFVVSTVSKV